MQAVTLYELNARIKGFLKRGFPEAVWITAEITEIQLNRSGHCYLQLADKREEDDSIIATARATIWAFTFRTLQPYFETTTGRALGKGMKVMLLVEVVFHELYGYSLNVRDVDPTYTIGDLERKKQEILKQLEAEGIINMNRELPFPLLPKNVAVISSPTAAGLGDFMNQLLNNSYHYRFHVHLFSAVMQGDKTTESVIAALDKIYEYESVFDVVVLIRGGGSQTDLGSFDTYDMAANIAQFPLPVIAGIGHERDETIVDRVAHLRVKTPTAAAVFLIDAFREQEENLMGLQSDFVNGVQDLLHEETTRQLKLTSDFKRSVSSLLADKKSGLRMLLQQISYASSAFIAQQSHNLVQASSRLESRLALGFTKERNQLDGLERDMQRCIMTTLAEHRRRLDLAATTVKYVDPSNVLKRGYSITRVNGKAIKDIAEISSGDCLESQLSGGYVKSVVIGND